MPGDFVIPTRARVDEFIAVVESGDHAGAIERYYTEDASMQENTSQPRVGRDTLVAFEKNILNQMSKVESRAVASVVEGNHAMIHWNFDMTNKAGRTRHFDEVAVQEWRGDRIFRERFFYDAGKPTV